ncbi:UbiA prenyltransferase family [Xylaria telfairii]|nr:UbiA prenyltransferase family [Xylaria telfairii]
MDIKHWANLFAGLTYHAYCIWLFTFSDLKTIIFPQSLFGLLTALSQTKTTPISTLDIAYRVPLVFGWVYANLLPFEINNQRQPEAIQEDKLNKPWRTMPSGKWTSNQAFFGMWFFYMSAGLLSWSIGVLPWSLCLMLLGSWYNNFGGSDVNPVVRNLINALGYTCFGVGALEVALNVPLNINPGEIIEPKNLRLLGWVSIVALIIMTTVQTQDMEDQMGDIQRGRRSLPVEIGDGPARWITAIFMAIWAPVCPVFWQSSWLGYAITMPWALLVAWRTLMFRGVEEDKQTFRLWNIWIMSIYLLPLL